MKPAELKHSEQSRNRKIINSFMCKTIQVVQKRLQQNYKRCRSDGLLLKTFATA